MRITPARNLLDVEGVAEALDKARRVSDRRGTQDVLDARLDAIVPGLAAAHDEWRKRQQERERARLVAECDAARIQAAALVSRIFTDPGDGARSEYPAQHLLMEDAL